ncbi:MAG: hypothetical protein RIB57_05125 [Pelagibacterium sp.]
MQLALARMEILRDGRGSEIGSVEMAYGVFVITRLVETMDIDDMEHIALPVAACRKRLDAALRAELMRNGMGIEPVYLERLAAA